MQAATQLLDAAMPLLGKRGPVEERHENFDTLRTHWLESMNARDPPTATTDDQRSERRVHTKRIEYMRTLAQGGSTSAIALEEAAVDARTVPNTATHRRTRRRR